MSTFLPATARRLLKNRSDPLPRRGCSLTRERDIPNVTRGLTLFQQSTAFLGLAVFMVLLYA